MHIDAHQHFWHYNDRDYGWMGEACAPLKQDLLPEDLRPLLDANGFDGCVAVQARIILEENDYLLALADEHNWIKGVVGWVDFGAPPEDLERQLEQYTAHPKMVGIRVPIHDMPDVNYATSAAHVHGVSRLGAHGLTYDLLLKPPHIRPTIELVRRFPGQPFVVDHLAKPLIRDGEIKQWREHFRGLAAHENVCCKLSGMVTEAKWRQWSPADITPYLDTALEAFGPSRLMIGSDWPVCTLAADYGEVIRLVTDHIAALSPDERDQILGGTCARFYGLR